MKVPKQEVAGLIANIECEGSRGWSLRRPKLIHKIRHIGMTLAAGQHGSIGFHSFIKAPITSHLCKYDMFHLDK